MVSSSEHGYHVASAKNTALGFRQRRGYWNRSGMGRCLSLGGMGGGKAGLQGAIMKKGLRLSQLEIAWLRPYFQTRRSSPRYGVPGPEWKGEIPDRGSGEFARTMAGQMGKGVARLVGRSLTMANVLLKSPPTEVGPWKHQRPYSKSTTLK
jgi:hypothetical protein